METRFFFKKTNNKQTSFIYFYIFECKWRNIQIFDQGVNFKFTVVSWISKGSYHQRFERDLSGYKVILMNSSEKRLELMKGNQLNMN
jgi:hypothetical protein